MYVRSMRQKSVAELDKYVIIDTHGGQEDIFGIVAALQLAKKYDKTILGITCVAGRNTVERAVDHALIAQQITGTRIPVYKGAKHSLMLNKNYPECYNFVDNSATLSNIKVEQQLKTLVQHQFAPLFIAEQIRKHGQELCLITLGPLTNIAIAFHQTQTIKVLSSIRINGGSSTAVGNIINSGGSEGNFYFDPESAQIVISNYNNIYINPIEKTLETSWKQLFISLKEKYSQNNQLNTILQLFLKRQYVLCGPLLTILPVFNKQTVTKILNVYSQVISMGTNIVGLMAANWLRLDVKQHEQTPNTKIYSNIDLQESKKIVHEAFLLK